MANLVVIFRSNVIDIIGIVLVLVGVFSYFFIFWFENLFLVFPFIFGSFEIEFSNRTIWLTFTFIVLVASVVEWVVHHRNYTKQQAWINNDGSLLR